MAVKRIQNIPPYLAYVATLPCETLMSAKQAINDQLQGSVAAYLRCGGVVNIDSRQKVVYSNSRRRSQASERGRLETRQVKAFTHQQGTSTAARARAWNDLPSSVRSAPSLLQFRRDLKTALHVSVIVL